MKIQYCSDLHLEFEANAHFLMQNPWQVSGDILLLAGDIAPLHDRYLVHPFLDMISGLYQMVFWVPGNHEYYHKDLMEFPASLNMKIRENIFVVNNLNFVYEEVHFVFSTLWSRIEPLFEKKIEQNIADFNQISLNDKKFKTSDYNKLHEQSLQFIRQSLNSIRELPSVVVTHHLPALQCNDFNHRHSALNDAYATDLSDFIEQVDASFWIYGHSHFNQKPLIIGKTLLLTNQLGNVKTPEKEGFNPRAFISV